MKLFQKISDMLKLSNISKKVRGFTLLELVIVIAIIGILAVIVLPNFIQALAKARDAKKMTELRGVQTFLTTTGIDTNLRYPDTQADLETWFSSTGNRTPQGLIGLTPLYNYKGINCDNVVSIKVGGNNYGTNCSSYQLWTELEADNAALRLDGDLAIATDCVAANIATYGPCVLTTSLDTALTTYPTQAFRALMKGQKEACTSRSTAIADADCIFDLVP